MKATIAKELVLNSLMMVVYRRKPKQQVIVHSDQDSQYGSDSCKGFCETNRLLPGMSRSGNCWDKAVAESFFIPLKKERIYKTRDLARADVFDYIEAFYNRRRLHSHLGGIIARRLNAPQFEAQFFLLYRGKSNVVQIITQIPGQRYVCLS